MGLAAHLRNISWQKKRFRKALLYKQVGKNSFPIKKKRCYPFELNQLEFPSPKNALCQVWLKLANWFWRMSIVLWKTEWPFFKKKKLEFPSPKDALCQVLASEYDRREFKCNQWIFTIISFPWHFISLKIICANLVEIGTAVLKCIAFTDRPAVRRRKKILDQNQALNRFQFVHCPLSSL